MKVNQAEARDLLEVPTARREEALAAARKLRDLAGGDGHAGLNLLATTRPGDKVALTVVRSGERMQFKMTVGVRPAGMEAPT